MNAELHTKRHLPEVRAVNYGIIIHTALGMWQDSNYINKHITCILYEKELAGALALMFVLPP